MRRMISTRCLPVRLTGTSSVPRRRLSTLSSLLRRSRPSIVARCITVRLKGTSCSQFAPQQRQYFSNLAATPPADALEMESEDVYDTEKQLSSLSAVDDMMVFQDRTLGEILRSKSHTGVLTVNETDTVFQAIAIMEQFKIGALLVRDTEGKVSGIITERDYLTKVALRGLSSREAMVRAIMTPDPIAAKSTDPASVVMNLMTARRFRHVPVLDAETNEVIGIASIGDLVKSVMEQMSLSVAYMRDYMEGKYAHGGSYQEGWRYQPEGYHDYAKPPAAVHTVGMPITDSVRSTMPASPLANTNAILDRNQPVSAHAST